jgi:hypothetical protein
MITEQGLEQLLLAVTGDLRVGDLLHAVVGRVEQGED